MFTYIGEAFIKNQYTFNTHVIRIVSVIRILPHLKGMIRKRMQLRVRNLNDYFLLRFRLLGWRGLFAGSFCTAFSGIVFLLSASDFGYKKGHFCFAEEMS